MGLSVDEVFELTKIDRWFLVQIEQIVKIELELETTTLDKIDAATLRALEQYTSQLGGSAQVSVQGDRASVNFRGTTPEALSQWLNQMRVNARLLPVQAQLERQANPAGWSGQLVLAGPGLQSDE
jgi:type II secretory pathway component PulM